MNEECPRCTEYKMNGKLYCGACGRYLGDSEQIDGGCPRCAWYKAEENFYCGACGRYLGTMGYPQTQSPDAEKRPSFIELILLTVCIAFMFIAVFEAITLAVHFPEIFSFLANARLNMILILPFPVAVFSISGLALQMYWTFVVTIIIACVIITIQKLMVKARSSGGITKLGAAEDTAAFWICVSISAMFMINFIVTVLTMASGSDVNVPDFGNKIEQMFGMANAAFWEEIITRVLYIGVPMVFISLFITGRNESYRCIFGGFGMSKTAVVLIIISGVIFGLAHYPGWDDQIWKVITAGLMGMFLGYVFVRFGLYASILLHFINNYLSSFDWMGVGGLLVIVSLLLLATGLIALIYILMRANNFGGSAAALPSFKNGYVKKD